MLAKQMERIDEDLGRTRRRQGSKKTPFLNFHKYLGFNLLPGYHSYNSLLALLHNRDVPQSISIHPSTFPPT